jgi:hypothetical protein
MRQSASAAKKVLLVKEKIDFDSFPNEEFVWLDDLSRGLLSQSSYYLTKNSKHPSHGVISLMPKNGLFDQLYVINQNEIPSKQNIQSAIIEDAKCFYKGSFSSSEIDFLRKIFPEISEWK